ncbi:MAG: TolC family protein [Acidobacteriota bacterium]
MSQQRYRTAVVAVVAAFVIGLPSSIFGQPSQSGAGQLAAQPGGSTLRLSIEDAVQMALENNLSLQVQRINPQLQDLNIEQVKAAWIPNLTFDLSQSNRTTPISSFFAGAEDKLTRDSFTTNVGAAQQLPWYGGSYRVTWDSSRTESNSVYDSPNPSLGSNVNLSFSQPFLRNFHIDSPRQQLLVSKKNREVSDIDLQQTMLSTIRSVKYAYWDVKSAVASLRVARQSLDLAQEQLRNNRSRVEIGTMAPIDVVEAEAEVARREEAVIVAEAAVRRADDRLRTLIVDPKAPDYWAVGFDLTDEPTFAPTAIDVDRAVRAALDKRTDLRQYRKTMEITDVNIQYYQNQTLPDVTANLSYGVTGQGGTKKNFGGGFPPQILGEISEGFGTVMSRLFSANFPSWTFAIQVSYPIGRSGAEANLARTRLQYEQAQIQLRDAELSVVTQVRDVARNVETNQKRLEATQAARRLAERRLEAEQKKFAAGMSTNYVVFQAQRDLANAQYSELVALLDYNRSLIDFETVQEAPTAGGSTISLASAVSAASR